MSIILEMTPSSDCKRPRNKWLFLDDLAITSFKIDLPRLSWGRGFIQPELGFSHDSYEQTINIIIVFLISNGIGWNSAA